MRQLILLLVMCVFSLSAMAQHYTTLKDIPYVSENETDAYRLERCKLDIYYPEGVTNFPTIVWYHGGGLEGGEKHIPEQFLNQGIAVVTVNYRLSPRAKNPAYIQDAAMALAWTFNHIEEYGGSKERIYVSGHSAGGYLDLILATDKKWLAEYGADADKVAAYFPISGQSVTHFTIRKERGLPNGIPIIDEFAPVNKTRANTAPIYMITGDRYLEMEDRWEENAHFLSVSKNIGNKNVSLNELEGFNHNTVVGPACIQIVGKIQQLCPDIRPLRLTNMAKLEQPARRSASLGTPKNYKGHDQMAPNFLIYPDAKLDAAGEQELIRELNLKHYMQENAASFIISGPVGNDYDNKADLDAFVKLVNELKIINNLKVIGIGRGATFVNTALAQNAGCIAGIATYGGKPVAAKALYAALNGEPYPVPAYLYGDAATANAANYLKLNDAKLTGTNGTIKRYANAEEPLQQVVVNTAKNLSVSEFMADAWENLLSKNYRFNNINHTWYTGCQFNQYGAYELEPYINLDELKITRKMQEREVRGLGNVLWYEYYPEGTDASAAKGSIPVMVLLHGNTNDPRTQAETSGFIELSAKEHFAVMELEWQGSKDYDAMGLDGIEQVLSIILEENPQLDGSRVYAEGLSAGSFTASTLGLHNTYFFAAVGGHSGGLSGPGGAARFGTTYELLMRNANQKRGTALMPYCSVSGVEDEVVIYAKPGIYEKSSIYNAWRIYQTLNGLDVVNGLDFNADKTFGMKLDNRQHIETNKHISMEVGEQRNAAGIPLIKYIAVNNYAHWNFKPTAQLMWDYYKQFRRNQTTGALEIIK